MTLYIIRRDHYTVYRYGRLVVLAHDSGEFSTGEFAIGDAHYLDDINRAVWEDQ